MTHPAQHDSITHDTDNNPTETYLPRLRPRLDALLEEYDTAVRGSNDALLAAYIRGCLSALGARHRRELPGVQQLRAAGNTP